MSSYNTAEQMILSDVEFNFDNQHVLYCTLIRHLKDCNINQFRKKVIDFLFKCCVLNKA